MPSRDDISIPLEPGKAYHIFNRGNESRLIFFQTRNYRYFLDKYVTYLSDYWDTHAYCLLPNHFHFAVGLKSRSTILQAGKAHFTRVSKGFFKENWPEITGPDPAPLTYEQLATPDFLSKHYPDLNVDRFLTSLAIWTVSERLRRFLLAYVKAINIQQKRHGSLFQKVFRRKLISNGFSRSLVAYIHRNPVHHGLRNSMEGYPWSSYEPLLDTPPPWLDQDTVFDRFGGREGFLAYHRLDLQNLGDFADLPR